MTESTYEDSGRFLRSCQVSIIEIEAEKFGEGGNESESESQRVYVESPKKSVSKVAAVEGDSLVSQSAYHVAGFGEIDLSDDEESEAYDISVIVMRVRMFQFIRQRATPDTSLFSSITNKVSS